jgi:hypothetical protein
MRPAVHALVPEVPGVLARFAHAPATLRGYLTRT